MAHPSLPCPHPPAPTLQVPDWVNATIDGKAASAVIGDEDWFRNEFTPVVATRGGALIKKWGRSSAASTAVSIADAIRALVTPTAPNDCFSSGVISDGNPYGVPDGINCSFPLRSTGDGNWEFVRIPPPTILPLEASRLCAAVRFVVRGLCGVPNLGHAEFHVSCRWVMEYGVRL